MAKTVLLVERDRDHRTITVTILYVGCRVLEVIDETEAMQLVEAERPDIVVVEPSTLRERCWQTLAALVRDAGAAPVLTSTARPIPRDCPDVPGAGRTEDRGDPLPPEYVGRAGASPRFFTHSHR